MWSIVIEILLAGVVIAGVLLVIAYLLKGMRFDGDIRRENVYDASYTPGMIGSSAGPLPIGGKRKRNNRD